MSALKSGSFLVWLGQWLFYLIINPFKPWVFLQKYSYMMNKKNELISTHYMRGSCRLCFNSYFSIKYNKSFFLWLFSAFEHFNGNSALYATILYIIIIIHIWFFSPATFRTLLRISWTPSDSRSCPEDPGLWCLRHPWGEKTIPMKIDFHNKWK